MLTQQVTLAMNLPSSFRTSQCFVPKVGKLKISSKTQPLYNLLLWLSKSDDYAEATITWHIEDKVTKVSASIQVHMSKIVN